MKKVLFATLALAVMFSCKNNNKAADAAKAAADGVEAAQEQLAEGIKEISDEELDAMAVPEIELSEEEDAFLDSFNISAEGLTLDQLATATADELAKAKPIPYELVAEKPSFKGGDPDKFRKWVNAEIVYPEEAIENKEEGKVFVQFVVNEEGKVVNAEVARTSGSETLDAEALRVISASPAWTPGQQNGIPVKVTYVFPVLFKLAQ